MLAPLNFLLQTANPRLESIDRLPCLDITTFCIGEFGLTTTQKRNIRSMFLKQACVR
jgi:hypothetical protein